MSDPYNVVIAPIIWEVMLGVLYVLNFMDYFGQVKNQSVQLLLGYGEKIFCVMRHRL